MSADRMNTKDVSLAAELDVLARAVQGLTRLLDVEEVATEDHQREAVALLWLLGARLGHLRRAVLGAEDPKSLLEPFNAADPPNPDDDPDIRIRAWPDGVARSSRRRRA